MGAASSAPASDGAAERYLAPESACASSDSAPLSDADLVAQMACLLDHARAVDGLRALRRSPLLATSAAIKAEDIVRCDFSHTACGHSINAPFELAHYIALRFWVELSENLGACAAGDSRALIDGGVAGVARTPRQPARRAVTWTAVSRCACVPPRGGAPPRRSGSRAWAAVRPSPRSSARRCPCSPPTRPRSAPPVAVRPPCPGAERAHDELSLCGHLDGDGDPPRRARRSVYFATQRARTNAQGRATIVARLPRPGRYRAIALSRGAQATVAVQIVRR